MTTTRSSDGEKESWKSLKELGNVHVKEGRFNEASIAYTQAIRLDPNQPVLYSNRSIVELRLKMYKEAREDAEDAFACHRGGLGRVLLSLRLEPADLAAPRHHRHDARCRSLVDLALEGVAHFLQAKRREADGLRLR